MSVDESRGLSETLRENLLNCEANKPFVAGDYVLSYSEFGKRTNQTLNLFDSIELQVGDSILVACADDVETSILYLSGLRFGLCVAVIDPASSVPEVLSLVDAVNPLAIFMSMELAENALSSQSHGTARVFTFAQRGGSTSGVVPGLITPKKKPGPSIGEDLRGARERQPVANNARPTIDEGATALVLFTSGTTSRPKGVELTYANLRAQFETFARHYGFGPDSRILNHLPLHHTDGLNQGPATALFCGATWIRPRGSVVQNVESLARMVREQAATHIVTVPTLLALMERLPEGYDDSFGSEDFAFINSTAGYLDETLWRRFERRFGVMVVNSYGLTETVSEALYCGPDEKTRRLGSVGRPVDCEARVVGASGEEVTVGATGELILRGTNVMKGYLNDPEATNAVLQGGWFHTGDLAQRDEDGFFFIVGRKKNLIIRAGINVYPDDVTNCVMQLEEVLEACTVGLPDSILGQKVVTCVTPSLTTQEGIADLVTKHCRTRLAPEKRPDHVVVVESLPRGPSGKVLLNDLNDIVSERLGGPIEGGSGTIEEQVIAVCASALGVPAESITGETSSKTLESWDSLAHLAMVTALEKQFGVTFQAEDIMAISDISSAISAVTAKRQA